MMSTSIVCLFFLLVSGLTSAVPDNDAYLGTHALLLTDKDPIPKKCMHYLVYGMIQAMCDNLNLARLPPTLPKDIQDLEFSGNRLRDLKNDTLSSFTSLEYLYLMDNFITSIEDATFVKLWKLKVLDLTTNGLNDIPKNIFALPVFKKLYLTDNKIGDSTFDPTPFADDSSIEYLNVAKNQLKKLPRLGMLPRLTSLNVSGNSITNIKSEDIAAFCSLKILDLRQNPIILTDSCECQALNAWIAARNITMFPSKFNCTHEPHGQEIRTPWCTFKNVNEVLSNETLRIYETCKNIIKVQEQSVKARSTWILVVSCVGVFLVCLFMILYCIHKRNKRKKAKTIKKDLALNANDELLKANNNAERVE